MSNKENREPENGDAIFNTEINNKYDYDSDEETEDASETDLINDEEEFIEIKEQAYHDKLRDLKKQLKQLEDRVHPAYVNGEKQLKEDYLDRQFKNTVFYAFEVERIRQEHRIEREAAYKDFNEKQKELKENLITDLEQQKKIYEAEKGSMDIVIDNTVGTPVPMRKLRRRGIELSPAPEPKRKKSSQSPLQIKFQLSEDEINEDLRKISEGTAERTSELYDSSEEAMNDNMNSSDIRVENGKLYYEKYWYHRGQQIYYEDKEVGIKNSAVISTINSTEVWVKRISDSEKYQIYISELLKGLVTLKRRSA